LSHLAYLALLAACLLGTMPLETLLHVGVYVQWRRLVATVLPVAVVFGVWDGLSAAGDLWTYNEHYLVGLALPGGLPIEEVLFFVVIPVCAVLTYEAVRVRKPHWAR
jgi:lycopene cyclase domain-containing protein